jgi:hypothetical protein
MAATGDRQWGDLLAATGADLMTIDTFQSQDGLRFIPQPAQSYS